MAQPNVLAAIPDQFDLDLRSVHELRNGLREFRMSESILCDMTSTGESCTCTDGGTCDFTCGGATGSPCAC
jgi:hypothetical protein